jgi:hypothetical protein
MSSVSYLGTYPLVFSIGSGASYLNAYQIPDNWGGYRGLYIGVPSGGSVSTIKLSTAQVQSMGAAIRQHLSTGLTNQTFSGIQVVSSGTASVNIVVAAVPFTINLTNDQASQLAQALLLYVSTGQPPQAKTGGSNYYDPNL